MMFCYSSYNDTINCNRRWDRDRDMDRDRKREAGYRDREREAGYRYRDREGGSEGGGVCVKEKGQEGG